MANKLIAITGGIGSGKSLALSILNNEGYNTLSSDAITAELYEKRKIKLILKRLFPSAVKGFFNPKINRKEISRIVFNDKEKLNRLTNTITPLVLEEIIKRAKKFEGTVFVEVPILFEKGYQSAFNNVIIVKRDKNKRIESVKVRSNLTEKEVIDRINNQFDYENSDLSPFITVINDNDESALKEKLLQIAKSL